MTQQTRTDSTDALAVYMRVSGEGQKTQGTIENQRAVLTRYLDAQGTAPYGWYEDEAVSGYFVAFPKRPDGARLLADIRAGHVGIVLVRKLDRFGRNAREILNAVHELEQAGARLISLKENVDTRTSAGRFFLTMLAGVAELERDVLMERIDEGTVRRLESTTWMGSNPPIGYRVEGRKRDAHLVIEDTLDEASGYSELDVVRLGWHLLVEQDWSVERICEQLDRLSIPTREASSGATSGRWSLGVIYRMLSSTIYAGERTYTDKDGVTHTHPVPAILTAEQVAQMHAALERHRRRDEPRPGDSDTAHAYLLRGLLRCSQCGQRYTTSWGYSARVPGPDGQRPTFRYYTCQTRHQRRSYRRRCRPAS
jgi:site-specific DNA recombinase